MGVFVLSTYEYIAAMLNDHLQNISNCFRFAVFQLGRLGFCHLNLVGMFANHLLDMLYFLSPTRPQSLTGTICHQSCPRAPTYSVIGGRKRDALDKIIKLGYKILQSGENVISMREFWLCARQAPNFEKLAEISSIVVMNVVCFPNIPVKQQKFNVAANHIAKKSGNFGWKSNETVFFRKIRSKIVD